MKLHVTHAITYRYSAPVILAPQHILMRPREHHYLSVLRYRLTLEPATKLFWVRDHHENSLAMAHYYDRMESLSLTADFDVETLEHNPFDFVVRLDATRYPFDYTPSEATLLAPYRDTPDGRSRPLLAWMRSTMPQFPDETLELLTQLNRTFREQLRYQERLEAGVQTPETTIELGLGTCRDFAVLMVHACHALGFAARFVSGYLFDPSVKPGKPAGSLHAWAEVYIPGAGWRGFDPTHAILADDNFIPVAVGRRPENLNPVTGAFWGSKDARSIMDATVEVRAL